MVEPTEAWGEKSLYRRLTAEFDRKSASLTLYVPSFTFVDHKDGSFSFESTDSHSWFIGWHKKRTWRTWRQFANDYWNGTTGVAADEERLGVLDQFSAVCPSWVFRHGNP